MPRGPKAKKRQRVSSCVTKLVECLDETVPDELGPAKSRGSGAMETKRLREWHREALRSARGRLSHTNQTSFANRGGDYHAKRIGIPRHAR